MSDRTVRKAGIGLLAELALWFATPILFVYMYVGRLGIPASAIVPHLRYLAVLFVGLALSRFALSAALGRSRGQRVASALLIAASLQLLVLYYLLVWIGLQSWGRVPSWDLVASYLPQMGELARTLDVSLARVYLAVAAMAFALVAAAWWYLGRRDWVRDTIAVVPARMQAAGLFLACGVFALETLRFFDSGDAARFEPFSLTFFPAEAVSRLNSTHVDRLRSALLDQEAERARKAYVANPSARKRNLVLIVVDALRFDHMGVYGYERATTPFLSGLEREGRLQKQSGMRSTCAESACGLLSLSSSKYVHEFSDSPFTLQEVLKMHGYAIHMILGGDHTNFYGLRKIYGNVDSYFDGSMGRGKYPNDDSLITARVDALPTWNARPTMFQLHLMSAHGLGKRLSSAMFSPARNYGSTPNAYTADPGSESAETRNYYDNGVLQTDAVIRSILASLQAKGYLDDALVVITADHGEGLGEHGMYTHSNSVHEELLRIPMLMIAYGKPTTRLPTVEINASQIDIAPTMLAELGMPIPPTWSGKVLQSGQCSAFTYFEQGSQRGLVDYRSAGQLWKYWKDGLSGAERAFELVADGREAHNLFAQVAPARKAEWRRQLLAPSKAVRSCPAS